ncbi:hypothetical protein A2U01_0069996, partial [Trifolium medium]|nr:hypothetical protein [Trifolium medium]
KEAAVVRQRACAYVILDSNLYRKGFSIPLLKCVEEDKVDYILRGDQFPTPWRTIPHQESPPSRILLAYHATSANDTWTCT